MVEDPFGRVAVEITLASAVNPRDRLNLLSFVADHNARPGVVVTTDPTVRRNDEKPIGLPFTHL